MNALLKLTIVSGMFVLLNHLSASSASAAAAADDQPFTIAERGPHHRVWEKVTLVTDDAGHVSSVTNSYTELATGLSRLDAGQWVDSVPQFELFQGGVVARQTQHKVILAPNPNTPNAVDLLMSDNGRLVSHVVGLIYFDRASGKSVTLAVIKDAQGVLQPGNQEVIFPDAFDGPFRASLRYRLSLAGLSQDIILEEQPPDPETFGLSSKSTEISAVTEFLQAPKPAVEVRVIRPETDPQVRQAMVEPDLVDQYLNFGAMQVGFGRGFLMNGQLEGLADGSLPVLKHWQVAVDGRTFLYESLQVASIADALKKLPAPKQANRTSPNRAKALASNGRSAPPTSLKKPSSPKPIQLAQTAYSGTGFVLDYSVLSSSSNFIFRADVTYFVSSLVNLSLTTTIEGGTVVKYDNTSTPEVVINGPIICLTSPYRSAVFTAKDDSSVGETVGTGPLTLDSYGHVALTLGTTASSTLSNLRFSYVRAGIEYAVGGTHTLWHSQFSYTTKGLYVYANADLSVRNVLFDWTVDQVFFQALGSIHGQNLTIHNSPNLSPSVGSQTLNFVNSLIVGVTNMQTFTGSNNHSSTTDEPALFQTVGGGYHYLTGMYRGAGTTSIDPTLLADLAKRTTYPPIPQTTSFSVNTTLSPSAQVPRNTGTPDYGYHYDPIDYVWTTLNLNSSITLLLTNGVAVGIYGDKGTTLLNSSKFISEGSPTNLNRLVRYNAVQEQPIVWGTSASPTSLINLNSTVPPEVRLRFTDVSLLNGPAVRRHLLYNNGVLVNPLAVTDCQLRGVYGDFSTPVGSGMTIALTNNLIQRSYLNFYQIGASGYTLNLYNNLFLNGNLFLNDNTSSTTWTVRDNLFDGVSLSGGNVNTVNNYNGYTTTTLGSVPLAGAGSNNKTLIVPDYQIGPAANFYGVVGNYYYPTTGTQLNALIDFDTARTADAGGLTGYTVRTNDLPEGCTPVDIGYHFWVQNAARVTIVATVPEAWEGNVNPAGPRVDGVFTVTRTGSLSAALTVLYQISGSAQNGVDYNMLTGSVVIPVGAASATITVVPIDDTEFELPEKVILTVTCNGTAYAVGIPGSAIVKIQDRDDPQPIFPQVNQLILALSVPVGIDYHPVRDSIIISLVNGGNNIEFYEIHKPPGLAATLTPWSAVPGLMDEVKLTIVQSSANNFVQGQMYFGNDTAGQVGRVSADGTSFLTNWAILSGEQFHIRGSLFVDRTGLFGSDLIAVTGDGTSDPVGNGGGIWRIKANSDGSSGTKTLVTNVNTHLEGVITLPNDSVKYGPWAGKMLVGAEVAHKIFIVDPSGNVTSTNFNVGSTNSGAQTFQRFLDPEDFDIIPADQDLYIVDTDQQLDHALAKYPRALFAPFVGDLLVVQAGEVVNDDAGVPGRDDKRFYIIHWDGTEFLIRNIFYTPGLLNQIPPLEHATFAPIDLP